jgi:hypothetical protein
MAGKTMSVSLYFFPIYLWFKDNSFLEASFIPTWQNINFDFAPLGLQIAEDDYFYTRYLIRYNSAFYQYNSFDKQGRWNIRASWEYLPLSFV